LTHDIITWETTWEHFGETALDGIGLIPLVGALGKSDEILLFVKRTEKLYEIRRVAKIGENLLESLKKAGNALENAMDAASTAMKQVGSRGYSNLLYVLDQLKQGGRWQLDTGYGTDFSKAFAEYGSELDNLARTDPYLSLKACHKTVEECTDAGGHVTKNVDEIKDVARKNIDEAVEAGNTAVDVFDEVADTHLITVEGFNRKHGGIKGGHNYQAFMEYTNTQRPIQEISRTESGIDGVFEIEYKAAKIDKGVPVEGEWLSQPYIKTVYDPTIISDETIKQWAREALEGKEVVVTRRNQLRVRGEASNGLKFEGWIDINTNKLRSYYPVLEWSKE
ncbi:EndoU domain-containing protein, partial [Anaeromicropila populeti]